MPLAKHRKFIFQEETVKALCSRTGPQPGSFHKVLSGQIWRLFDNKRRRSKHFLVPVRPDTDIIDIVLSSTWFKAAFSSSIFFETQSKNPKITELVTFVTSKL